MYGWFVFRTTPQEVPQQQRADDEPRREVDARGPERHHEAEALEAPVAGEEPEEAEAAARHVGAQKQGLVAGVPFPPVPAGVVARLAVAVDHEHAVLVAGAN